MCVHACCVRAYTRDTQREGGMIVGGGGGLFFSYTHYRDNKIKGCDSHSKHENMW